MSQNLRGKEGVSKQADCLNFACPKVSREEGSLGNLGQCLNFYCFLRYLLLKLMLTLSQPFSIKQQFQVELSLVQLSPTLFCFVKN